MKFKFRMQPLLNVRMTQESLKLEEMGAAMDELRERQNALEIINQNICKKTASLKSSISSLKVSELANYSLYISHLNDIREKQKINIKRQDEIVDKIRVELIDAIKERKIFEKLKQNKFHEYSMQLTKNEQKINDDLVSYKQHRLKPFIQFRESL